MSIIDELKDASKEVWEACYNHPFVQEIGKGTLPQEKFNFFLIQDYKFLMEYIKILSLSSSYINDEKVLYQFLGFQKRTIEGRNNQKKYLQELGLDEVNTVMGLYNESYISSLRSVATTKGTLALLVAILPCPWSYHEFACRLQRKFGKTSGNKLYQNWIESYARKDTYKIILKILKAYENPISLDKNKELKLVFKRSLEYEYLFWDMCYKKKLSY